MFCVSDDNSSRDWCLVAAEWPSHVAAHLLWDDYDLFRMCYIPPLLKAIMQRLALYPALGSKAHVAKFNLNLLGSYMLRITITSPRSTCIIPPWITRRVSQWNTQHRESSSGFGSCRCRQHGIHCSNGVEYGNSAEKRFNTASSERTPNTSKSKEPHSSGYHWNEPYAGLCSELSAVQNKVPAIRMPLLASRVLDGCWKQSIRGRRILALK